MPSISAIPVDLVQSLPPEHDWEKYYRLKPNDTYVEVGAYWGRYAQIASIRGCSKIILIEPSPINIATIENLINLRYIVGDVQIVKKGIYSRPERMQFINSGNPSGHRITTTNTKDTIEIDVDSLDNILTNLDINQVDLLACDCENYEVELMKGSEKYLTEKRIKHLAIGAYHSPENPDIIMDILKIKGYRGIKYEDNVVYAHT